MSKTKIPAFFMLMLLLVLTGCGGGGRNEDADASAPADNAVAQQEAPAEEDAPPAGDAAEGEKIFNQTCIACHGEGGVGVQNLGKDMTHSEFIAGLSDDELVDFIKTGRDTSDPLNTTGVAMPSRGGNPALSDEDLFDVVAYIRTIHE
ncbi:MAG: cytochrome c [Caldilineaceae bacterium]|nr:cytochrome c [Caldilineaceae bacterium]